VLTLVVVGDIYILNLGYYPKATPLIPYAQMLSNPDK